MEPIINLFLNDAFTISTINLTYTAALNCPTDDAFLLRFLRARKFDYERAYQLLVNYYTVRAENPDVFKDFKPSTIKHVLEDGVSTFLPKRNKDGQAVLFFRPGSVCSIAM